MMTATKPYLGTMTLAGRSTLKFTRQIHGGSVKWITEQVESFTSTVEQATQGYGTISGEPSVDWSRHCMVVNIYVRTDTDALACAGALRCDGWRSS